MYSQWLAATLAAAAARVASRNCTWRFNLCPQQWRWRRRRHRTHFYLARTTHVYAFQLKRANSSAIRWGAGGDRVCTQIKSSLSDWNMVCNIRVEYLILAAREYKSDAEKGKNSLSKGQRKCSVARVALRPFAISIADCCQKVRRTENEKKNFFIRHILRNAAQQQQRQWRRWRRRWQLDYNLFGTDERDWERGREKNAKASHSVTVFMFAVVRHGYRLRIHLRGEQRKVPTSK